MKCLPIYFYLFLNLVNECVYKFYCAYSLTVDLKFACVFLLEIAIKSQFSQFFQIIQWFYTKQYFSVFVFYLKKKPWTHYVNCVFVGTVEFSIYYIWIPCNIWIRYLLIDVWLSKFCECCWMDHKVFCF